MSDESPYPWIGADDAEYLAYMRDEWGVPVRDDRKLFEMLILETFQAGLSWSTILRRRKGFRKAFANWSLGKVSAFGPNDVERLMNDEGIIRNRRKIEAAVANANAIILIKKEFGSLAKYLWDFVGGEPILPGKPYKSWKDIPAETESSRALSRDLKKRGFKFVGPTSCYAFMQAVGLADDRLK
jgi:DNA-3-methyladenine glycosylase I